MIFPFKTLHPFAFRKCSLNSLMIFKTSTIICLSFERLAYFSSWYYYALNVFHFITCYLHFFSIISLLQKLILKKNSYYKLHIFVKVNFLYIHPFIVKYKIYTILHHHIFFLFNNSMICAEIMLIYSLEKDGETGVKQWISSHLVQWCVCF